MLFLNTLHGIYLHTFFADLPIQNLDIRDVVVAGGVGEGGQQYRPRTKICMGQPPMSSRIGYRIITGL